MDDITMTAPPTFAPGDTTYAGQGAYTITPQHTIEHVQEADIHALEAAGYTRPEIVTAMPLVLPTPEPDPQPAPVPEPAPVEEPAEPETPEAP